MIPHQDTANPQPAPAEPQRNLSRGRGRGHRGPRRPRPQESRTQLAPRVEAPREEGKQPSIRLATAQVDQIKETLERVLEEINDVLRLLDQIEREHSASEVEIESLRQSLRSLHRG